MRARPLSVFTFLVIPIGLGGCSRAREPVETPRQPVASEPVVVHRPIEGEATRANPMTFGHATIRESCGAAGGVAVLLQLTPEPVPCEVFPEASITFLIDGGLSGNAGPQVFATGSPGMVIVERRLRPRAGGEETSEFSLEIEHVTHGQRARGRWMASFSDGRLSGTFDASWCEPYSRACD